jgi:hypothetical protein
MDRVRSLAACAALLLVCVACSSVASPTASTLSFAEMQSFNPGLDGEWMLAEYPFARDVTRHPNGRLARMGYWVTDPQGQTRPVMFSFDRKGILTRKEYGGPVVRPPERGAGTEDVGIR